MASLYFLYTSIPNRQQIETDYECKMNVDIVHLHRAIVVVVVIVNVPFHPVLHLLPKTYIPTAIRTDGLLGIGFEFQIVRIVVV